MISKNKINSIRSLKHKSSRIEQQVFIVEGVKMVEELLKSDFEIIEILFTDDWIPPKNVKEGILLTPITAKELSRISQLSTPNQVLALAKIPVMRQVQISENLVLALDGIQDPGNLGTIIRTADWFGITSIVASANTADAYNPKVVQATMGSIFRVNINYVNLEEWLMIEQKSVGIPIYGAVLDGENIYKTKLTNKGIIVLGNESKGLSVETEKLLTHKLKIPNFSDNPDTAESLNVSMAAAIICAEFRRQQL